MFPSKPKLSRRLLAACVAGALGVIAASEALAAPAASAAPAATPQSSVDPAALDALNKMGAYLRTLMSFKVTMDTQRDDVDDNGQLVTLDGHAVYQVRRPNAFTIDLTRPGQTRRYIYDGKTVTVFDPQTGYYAKFDAPPTIHQTLDLADEKYGVKVPLDDLFAWTEGSSNAQKLTSAHYVGTARLGDQDADQYAFRQPGIDWQIWIAKGDKPLPLRVSIAASDDPARPQFQANLTWERDQQFADDTFVFTPPANARSIAIKPLTP